MKWTIIAMRRFDNIMSDDTATNTTAINTCCNHGSNDNSMVMIK